MTIRHLGNFDAPLASLQIKNGDRVIRLYGESLDFSSVNNNVKKLNLCFISNNIEATFLISLSHTAGSHAKPNHTA